VTLPFKIVLAGVFNYTAGTPFTKYDYANHVVIGDYQAERSPALLNLDLRLEKQFPLKQGTIRIIADAFNATNRENIYETVQDISGRIGEYGSPYRVGSPRIIQLSARFEW
jgi:hypothetical protein